MRELAHASVDVGPALTIRWTTGLTLGRSDKWKKKGWKEGMEVIEMVADGDVVREKRLGADGQDMRPRNEFFPVDGARSLSCLLPSLERTAPRQTHDAKYKMDNKQNNNPRALGLMNCDSSLTVNKMAVNKAIERGRLFKKKDEIDQSNGSYLERFAWRAS